MSDCGTGFCTVTGQLTEEPWSAAGRTLRSQTSRRLWGTGCWWSGWRRQMGLLHMGHTLRISNHFSRHLHKCGQTWGKDTKLQSYVKRFSFNHVASIRSPEKYLRFHFSNMLNKHSLRSKIMLPFNSAPLHGFWPFSFPILRFKPEYTK